MHFANAAFFTAIMPPYLPFHLELVYLSGVFEIALGLAILPLATRAQAGLGLVAVFPANIHMALNPDAYVEAGTSIGFIYGRLPFQFLFMYWAWWATRPDAPSNPSVAVGGEPSQA